MCVFGAIHASIAPIVFKFGTSNKWQVLLVFPIPKCMKLIISEIFSVKLLPISNVETSHSHKNNLFFHEDLFFSAENEEVCKTVVLR